MTGPFKLLSSDECPMSGPPSSSASSSLSLPCLQSISQSQSTSFHPNSHFPMPMKPRSAQKTPDAKSVKKTTKFAIPLRHLQLFLFVGRPISKIQNSSFTIRRFEGLGSTYQVRSTVVPADQPLKECLEFHDPSSSGLSRMKDLLCFALAIPPVGIFWTTVLGLEHCIALQ